MLAGELRLVYALWFSAVDVVFWCYFVSLVVWDDCEPYMRKLVDTSDRDLRYGTRFSGRHISAADFLPLSQHGVAGVIVCACLCVFFVSRFFSPLHDHVPAVDTCAAFTAVGASQCGGVQPYASGLLWQQTRAGTVRWGTCQVSWVSRVLSLPCSGKRS